MWEVMRGTIKVTVFFLSTNLNQGTTDINFPLTTSYTNGCMALVPEVWADIAFVLSSVVTTNIVKIAGVGIVTTSQSGPLTVIINNGAFDTVRFVGAGGSAPAGGICVLIGE